MISTPGILLIAVNYQTTQDAKALLECLSSLMASEEVRVVVADNSPDFDPDLAEAADRFDGCEIVRLPHNPGYFEAAAQVMEIVVESGVMPMWVIISNVDLTLEPSGFVERLKELAADESVLCVAPRIVSVMDGRDQNPFLESKPSKAAMYARLVMCRVEWLYRLWAHLNRLRYPVGAAFRRRREARSPEGERTRSIYAPHGSFVILSHLYFERGGTLLNEQALYGEEVLIGERVKRLGGEVLYEPRLVVHHAEHASLSKVSLAKRARLQGDFAAFMIREGY